MINTLKIKARMVELGITQKDLAERINLAQPTVNQKLNNIRPMDLVEAEKISEILQINPCEYKEYFFYQ